MALADAGIEVYDLVIGCSMVSLVQILHLWCNHDNAYLSSLLSVQSYTQKKRHRFFLYISLKTLVIVYLKWYLTLQGDNSVKSAKRFNYVV